MTRTHFLLIGTLLALASPMIALAESATRVEASVRHLISENAELLQSLEMMGLDRETAVNRFIEAERVIGDSIGHSPNLGQIALCGGIEGRAFVIQMGWQFCTTLFDAYSFGVLGLGQAYGHLVGAIAATIESIYFRAADGDYQKPHCYAGASGLVAAEYAVGGRVLMEIQDCGTADHLFNPGGFFLGIRAGIGAGADFGAQVIKVQHLKSYW